MKLGYAHIIAVLLIASVFVWMSVSNRGNDYANPRTLGDVKNDNTLLAGGWRMLTQDNYYDTGGEEHLFSPTTLLLELKSDGTWQFGKMAGTWTATGLKDEDIKLWNMRDAAVKSKITLNGWENGIAEGPITESEKGVEFIWLIYRVQPPNAQWPGQTRIKFGRT